MVDLPSRRPAFHLGWRRYLLDLRRDDRVGATQSLRAQLPGFSDAFDAAAPEILKGCAPPMLTALPEPGTLQIWTGLIVRTSPGWHLLVRAPANLPLTGGIVLYEGIVEADTWFGPLFTNLRFTRTHSPITLRPDFPLLQVQPVLASNYADNVLDSTELVPGMSGMA